MPTPSFIIPNFHILYVDDPRKSAAFYASLLGRPPAEASPTFAMFALENGVMLDLWSRHTVEPRAACTGGGTEVAFAVAGGASQVDALHAEWRRNGLHILQPPERLDFGYTFVALDPDQHRLRVFAPADAS